MPVTDYVYDIETYVDMFSCDITHVDSSTRWIFEVSERVDQSRQFFDMLYHLNQSGGRMFGYNNEGFDWPVCQYLADIFANTGSFTAFDAYEKAQRIIKPKAFDVAAIIIRQTGCDMRQALPMGAKLLEVTDVELISLCPTTHPEISVIRSRKDDFNSNRFAHTLWPQDRLVKQGDLMKIHHFDNVARSTSLKKLEINMRADRVIDLPYSPHELLTDAQKSEIVAYMCHDVRETIRFYNHSADQISFRDDLAIKYPDMGDVINFNDTKIGKQFFEQELERKVPGSCYQRVGRRRQKRQTIRNSIALRDVISPKVIFTRPEFQEVLDWMNDVVLTKAQVKELKARMGDNGGPPMDDPDARVETKGVLKGVNAVLDGFQFDFGTGGIHGSLKAKVIRATDTHDLIDVDVASYYPNLAISNGWFPEHLSSAFCDIYQEVYDMRKSHAKGTAENAMLKLALNGVYGDSNNKYSPFYDPQYTMAITVNGQLYLCMLAEWLTAKTGGTMVQINTDGLTMLVPKENRDVFKNTCDQWEVHTGLELEHVDYESMHIRDVNSYIAKTTKGKIKRIGAYAYLTPHDDPYTRERQWHQDHSALVVRKAAEAVMIHSADVAETIGANHDMFDFMLSVKVPRTSKLFHGDEQIQGTSRYYVTTNGKPLTKVMPPLAGKTEPRRFAVQKGWNVTIVNDVANFDWSTINWLYYIESAKALVVE